LYGGLTVHGRPWFRFGEIWGLTRWEGGLPVRMLGPLFGCRGGTPTIRPPFGAGGGTPGGVFFLCCLLTERGLGGPRAG